MLEPSEALLSDLREVTTRAKRVATKNAPGLPTDKFKVTVIAPFLAFLATVNWDDPQQVVFVETEVGIADVDTLRVLVDATNDFLDGKLATEAGLVHALDQLQAHAEARRRES
jgi:hypothetical protein